jgi:hypothetical protein
MKNIMKLIWKDLGVLSVCLPVVLVTAIGYIVIDESPSWLWWIGALVVVAGFLESVIRSIYTGKRKAVNAMKPRQGERVEKVKTGGPIPVGAMICCDESGRAVTFRTYHKRVGGSVFVVGYAIETAKKGGDIIKVALFRDPFEYQSASNNEDF